MRISDWSSDVCSSDLYALEVSGDSMVEAGILDGDYALVRRTDVARDGEIVVALIDDEEATLKYFRREGSMIRLDPANRNHEPQRYPPMRIRSEEHTSELQSLMRTSYAVFCLKKNNTP